MIRRSTWIVLVVLLAMIGLSFYLRDRQTRELAVATPTKGMAPLFDSGEGDPTMIKVESSLGLVVQFSRNEDGKWVLDAPEETEADQAAAEAAATQVGALRVLSTVALAPDIIGLDTPDYTLTVAFGDSGEYKLLVGSITPIQDGYYAQLDGGQYRVVDKFGLDELIGLLINPPYLATPIPRASPTPVAYATPSAETGTPNASPPTATPNSQGQITVTSTP